MTTFERIKSLADKQKISLKELAIKLGFSENNIYRWKTSKPKGEDLAKIADYFHVSVDYLLGRNGKELELPNLSVEQILDSVENYSGGELSESDREMLRIIIEAKKAAVEKESKSKG